MEIEFRGHKFVFKDTATSKSLVDEIFGDNYKVFEKGLVFEKGDIVLDIGASEGMFSVMMSKCFPETRIISFEPVPKTFFTLRENLELNGCGNVEANNYGVGGKDVKSVVMYASEGNSGGSTYLCTYMPECQYKVEVSLFSLDEVFSLCGIDRCKLLKMDVEGAEYDILYDSSVLPKVDNMVAEFHINSRLEFQSRRVDGLITWVANQTNLIHAEICRMAE